MGCSKSQATSTVYQRLSLSLKGIALPCKGSFGGGGLRWECGFVVIGDFTIIKVHLFRPAYVLIVYAFILINNNNNNNLDMHLFLFVYSLVSLF